jgi:hypothetical protein
MFVALTELLPASLGLHCYPLFSGFFWKIFLKELLELRVDIVYRESPISIVFHPINENIETYQRQLASRHHPYRGGKSVPSFSAMLQRN